MSNPGKQRRLRNLAFLLAVSFVGMGIMSAPARAFFFFPLPPSISTPSTPVPIVVPPLPPQIVPVTPTTPTTPTTPVTPETPPGTTPTGPTPPPDSAPEPTSLITALLGSAGLGLFAVYRRYRPRCSPGWNVRGGCDGAVNP